MKLRGYGLSALADQIETQPSVAQRHADVPKASLLTRALAGKLIPKNRL